MVADPGNIFRCALVLDVDPVAPREGPDRLQLGPRQYCRMGRLPGAAPPLIFVITTIEAAALFYWFLKGGYNGRPI